MKFNKKIVSYTKDTHQIWCRSAHFLKKSKFCSGSGSWFYLGFQYETYISYIQDTHQILFGSANSFKSHCVYSQDPRTYIRTYSQTDRLTEFFLLVLHTKHEHSSKEENFFSLMRTILSLFTYSVCDEKVKIILPGIYFMSRISFWAVNDAGQKNLLTFHNFNLHTSLIHICWPKRVTVV